MTAFRKVTLSPDDPADPMDFKFELTPQEKTFASWMSVHLEKKRREQNAKDQERFLEFGQ